MAMQLSGSLNLTGSLTTGQLSFIENTIESVSPDIDIQIGLTSSLANLVINRDVVVSSSKTLTINGPQTISGSLTLSSGSALNINNGFYVNGNRQFNYGQFYDTTTQSGSANTAYPMGLNTTDISSGVSIISGSQIKVDNTGIYNLQFSAQFQETVNASDEISVWLRKGGVDVANSNTELTIEKVSGGGKIVAAWNYMVQLNATEYVELVWSSNVSTTQLHSHSTQTSPTRPAVPSVIVTLTQIA
jgi:hypothetical protein